MDSSKLIDDDNKYEFSTKNISRRIYKGACVRIKNSQKTFQVIGFNPDSKVCWIREWPLNLKSKKTFSLKLNQITLQTFCANYFSEN